MKSSFGRLVADLSTRFTGLPVEELDGEIERALRLFVELLGTDRSTFFLIGPDGRLVQTHTWAREGIEPCVAIDFCRGDPGTAPGWWPAT